MDCDTIFPWTAENLDSSEWDANLSYFVNLAFASSLFTEPEILNKRDKVTIKLLPKVKTNNLYSI